MLNQYRILIFERCNVQVTEEWVRQLYQGCVQPLQTDSNFCASVAEKYLARSCPVPPAPWTRLTVKTWPKSQEDIQT